MRIACHDLFKGNSHLLTSWSMASPWPGALGCIRNSHTNDQEVSWRPGSEQMEIPLQAKIYIFFYQENKMIGGHKLSSVKTMLNHPSNLSFFDPCGKACRDIRVNSSHIRTFRF